MQRDAQPHRPPHDITRRRRPSILSTPRASRATHRKQWSAAITPVITDCLRARSLTPRVVSTHQWLSRYVSINVLDSRARTLALGIADHMHCLMTRRRMTALRLCKVRVPHRLEGADRTFMRGRILGSTRGLDCWAVVIVTSSNVAFVLYFHRQ